MQQAQGKVLESLYGLGTDMTVTKAAPPASEGGRAGPRFKFDAQDGEKTQSSDIVMPQGFQTLASSTVDEVAGQSGVSDAVGGLSLSVLKVDGEFKPGQFKPKEGGASGGGGGGGGPQGEVRGGEPRSTSTPTPSTGPTPRGRTSAR